MKKSLRKMIERAVLEALSKDSLLHKSELPRVFYKKRERMAKTKKLEQRGYVEVPFRGFYKLTEEGARVLANADKQIRH